MARLYQTELLRLLLSDCAPDVKRGIQLLCNALESPQGRRLRVPETVVYAINKHMTSSDLLTRRWLYKYIGLSGDLTYAPFVKGQLSGREQDPENLTWAAAALFGIMPTPLARQTVLTLDGLDHSRTIVDISSRYFLPGEAPLPRAVVRRALETGGPLDHLWLCLVSGKNATAVPKEAVRELNTSADSTVVEYSLWSFSRDEHGTIDDSQISPFDITGHPENVRRWYYRLLAKQGRYLRTYREVASWGVTKDPSALAREGMALGFSETWPGRDLAIELATHFFEEPDRLVRMALLRGFKEFGNRSPEYREVLAQCGRRFGGSDELAAGNGRERGGGKVIMSGRRRSQDIRGQVSIVDSEDAYVYVLAIDTVGFSQKTDTEQFVIFTDILGVLNHNETLRRVDAKDLLHLFTGDGLILAIKGVKNRHVPLVAAMEIASIFSSLRSYQLRIGVNSGPSRWIHISDGTQQVISHAINWAVRVMDSARPNEVRISDSYYMENVRSQTDRVPGMTMSECTGVSKHGESIPCYSVSMAG